MDQNSNRIALVTGAAARIGKGIAISLAEEGWIIAVHYCSASDNAGATIDEINSKGGIARGFEADFRKEGEVVDLIPKINKELGPILCLINNASVFEEDNIRSVTRETWEAHMEVNLRAPFVLSQIFASSLRDQKNANIINMIDQRVLNLTPFFTSYTISKSALWTLTQTMAIALAPEIRVNALGLGPTLTSSRQSSKDFDRQVSSTPLKTAVKVYDVCQAIGFILRTKSLTGQLVNIDSGQHLGWAFPTKDNHINE